MTIARNVALLIHTVVDVADEVNVEALLIKIPTLIPILSWLVQLMNQS